MLKSTYYNLLKKYEKNSTSQASMIDACTKHKLLKEIDFHIEDLLIKKHNREYLTVQTEKKLEKLITLSDKIYHNQIITEEDYKNTYTYTYMSIKGIPLSICISLILVTIFYLIIKQ